MRSVFLVLAAVWFVGAAILIGDGSLGLAARRGVVRFVRD